MLKIIRKTLLVTVSAVALTACEGTAQKFNEWGQSMPTSNDAWCEGWFCWDDTTTKQEAFRPAQNPGGAAYSPQGNYPGKSSATQDPEAQIQQQMQQMQNPSYASPSVPMGQPQMQQQEPPSYTVGSEIESKAAKELGIIPPEEAYGRFEGKGSATDSMGYGKPLPPGVPPGTVPPPPPPRSMMYKGGAKWQPPKDPTLDPMSNLPKAFKKNDDLPPGAVPGENWPPVPPEEDGEVDNTFGFGPSFR